MDGSTGAAPALPMGDYRFAFALARTRYRALGGDAQAVLNATAALDVRLP